MNWKKTLITVFRVAIGWHFLYEGISKLLVDNWSAAGYLSSSTGPFAGFYKWMASSEGLMSIIDPANIIGLILIGLGLFLGLAIRLSSIAGIVLLLLYYFAHPPFGGSLLSPVEGSLYIVNKNLIEALALLVFVFLSDKGYGLYHLKIFSKNRTEVSTEDKLVADNSRREAIKNLATLPALGLLGIGAFVEKKTYGVDTLSGATIQIGGADLKDLKGELPKGKIGEHEISRLVAGGNLIGGWAHSRDLRYVPALFRAYNSEKKKKRKPKPLALAAAYSTGGLAYQRRVKQVEHLGGGAYEVTFKKSVKGCYLFAQASDPNPSGGGSTTVIATPFFSPSSKKLVRVYMWDTDAGAAVDNGFFLQVAC